MGEGETFVDSILNNTNKIKKQGGIPFSTVIEEVTGKKIIKANSEYIKGKLGILANCFNKIVENSKIRPIKVKRVNELGNALEPILKNQINTTKLKCGLPLTALGRKQSSGYPDLIMEDNDKTIYIEVKTYAKKEGSLTSSFRSFYYEPKKDTSKVNKDGYHLLIAFGHIGKDEDNIGYVLDDWHLIDLSKINVFFKGEFQSNNKNMYKKENIIAKMEN